MQKIKAKGHWVQKLEWKQTDRQTDGGNCIMARVSRIAFARDADRLCDYYNIDRCCAKAGGCCALLLC